MRTQLILIFNNYLTTFCLILIFHEEKITFHEGFCNYHIKQLGRNIPQNIRTLQESRAHIHVFPVALSISADILSDRQDLSI